MKNRKRMADIALSAEQNRKAGEYWRERLEGEWEKSVFPYDPVEAAEETGEASVRIKFSAEVNERLEKLRNRSDQRLFMILAAGLAVVLNKYTGSSDIVLGAPVVKQEADANFINTVLVLRLALQGETTYRELLLETRKAILEATENVNFPLEIMLRDRGIAEPRLGEENPLFDVAVMLENIHTVRYLDQVRFNQIFTFTRVGESVEGRIKYNQLRYRRETVERIARHYRYLMEQVLQEIERPLAELQVLTREERRLQLEEWNRTSASYPQDKTIHRLFEEQVDRTPDRVALSWDDYNITYRDLEEEANRQANYLLDCKGIRLGEPVGLMMSNSHHQVIALLGILKAGGAYVPIDPSMPEERIKTVIDDAGIGILLSQKKYIRTLNRLQWECKNGLHTYQCLDSDNVRREEETEKNEMMDEELWRHVGETASDDITGGGWFSSYTGEPFTRKEMDEYGDNVLKKLTPLLHPGMRVLEIGCASGITMFRVAPLVGHYYGTDLSAVIIEKNRQRVEKEGHGNISLSVKTAHEIDEIEGEPFDLIVINSVIQSFHGHNYLAKVIAACTRRLRDQGCIFIGDIMDQDKKEDLIADMKAFKQANRGKNYPTKTVWNTELFVSRDYFEDLGEEIPGITHLEFSEKIHTVPNELTRYRYDLLMTIDKTVMSEKKKPRDARNRKYREDSRALPAGGTGRPAAKVTPEHPVYIIYTSGTMGKPKGVVLQHRSLVNYAAWGAKQYIGDTGNGTFPLYTTLSFDLTVTSVYLPLVTGNRIVIYPETDDQMQIGNVVGDDAVDIMKATPSHLKVLQHLELTTKPRRLKTLIVGGEKLESALAADIMRTFPSLEAIYNEYGPTETTVGSMIYRYDKDKDNSGGVPIGRPIANTGIFLLDQNKKPVPENVSGEIYITGHGLAAGYVNKPELTAERFITIDVTETGSLRAYKTGDSAVRQTDGNVDYRGRKDRQVKIRGYRVETAEIEARLIRYDGIKEGVVRARPGNNGDNRLCAYFVSEERDGRKIEINTTLLMENLQQQLPDYMVPTHYVPIPEIPLTANGKLDTGNLPEPDQLAVGSESAYAAPTSPMEIMLAETWKAVLGRKQISIHENFFMIGGDSIKSIQIASRMSRQGFKVEIKDIFQRPTISQLAPHVKSLERIPDQSMITGTVPLTPIQEWFFREPAEGQTQYNLSVMLYSKQRQTKERVKKIFNKLQHHHDALRTTFRQDNNHNNRVEQIIGNHHHPLEVEEHDHCGKPDASQRLRDAAQCLQTGINLETGPLMKIGLMHHDDGDRILIVIHHLVVDGVSWRILLEDIDTLYRQAADGRILSLPQKTDSFREWARELKRLAHQERLLEQRQYWTRRDKTFAVAIKRDNETPDTGDFIRDAREEIRQITEEETALLLTNVNQAFGTDINDILLSALGEAFAETFGMTKLPVALEGHGRENIIEGIDVNRTVGWFTSVYPVELDMTYRSNPARQLTEIKETLRQVPQKGVGYGILKYLAPPEIRQEMEELSKPQVCFTYLGQFDEDIRDRELGIAEENPGPMVAENRRRPNELQLDGLIVNKRLQMRITYNKNHYKPETIRRLVQNYRDGLVRLIHFCTAQTRRRLTPSDMTGNNVPVDVLNRLQEQYDVQDIYNLSPMQEGIRFHTEMEADRELYFEQVCYRLHGKMDLSQVKNSIRELQQRHDILRTVFVHEGLEHPMQLVLNERDVDFTVVDISEIPAKQEKEVKIESIRRQDRQRGFDLSEDGLMRVIVVKLGEQEYDFTWSFHHIIVDGWCGGIIIAEAIEIYYSRLNGRPLRLPEVKPYKHYIQWLQKQDKEKSLEYWRKHLEGLETMTGIPRLKEKAGDRPPYKRERLSRRLDEERTHRLNKMSGRNFVTINTLVQAAWGIILAEYNDREDVVFGAVVSGRPAEILEVETMVGLFINTIPVRINSRPDNTFKNHLVGVQQDAIAAEPNHYIPLAEIQAQSPLKRNLLDHIIAFENYPIEQQIGAVADNDAQSEIMFKISDVDNVSRTNYDFNVAVVPGEQLTLRFEYNGNCYDRDYIEQIAGHLVNLFDQVIENIEIPVRRIDLLSDREKHRLLREFNGLDDAPSKDNVPWKSIRCQIEEQVRKIPDNIALTGPLTGEKDAFTASLSYRCMNGKANRLAHRLKRKGVGRESVVALHMRRSLDMIIGILAVLKAGAAYQPVDPGTPPERVIEILDDTGVSLVLTHKAEEEKFSTTTLKGFPRMIIKPRRSSPRPSADFDSLPIPDRSLLDYTRYNKYIGHAMVKNSISMLGSRGCPFNCAYCHRVWPKKHVFRSAENIFEEVKFYYDLGVRRFDLIDDIFNFNVKNSTQFFQSVLDHKMDIQLFFPNGMRGDILTREYIDRMIEAGTVNIDLALETASPRLQKLIGKNLDIPRFRDNIQYIAETYPQVILDLNVMYGFPTETEEEAQMSSDFIKSVRWLHFPYVFILKIHPNTGMGKLALENGVSAEAIARSMNYSYHDIPDTLPFSKQFARELKNRFFTEYFLSKERLRHVLPHQLRAVTADELVQKYDNYLPMKISGIDDILSAAGLNPQELGNTEPRKDGHRFPPDFRQKVKRHFHGIDTGKDGENNDAMRILLLDVSELYSSGEQHILHGEIVVPHGIMSLMTFLQKRFGNRVTGKIAKSKVDFDGDEQLKTLIDDVKPHLIGIRTLSYYKDFFHRTVEKIREWGIDAPIIAGGPYATMDYRLLLQDPDVNMAVIGEGEYTMAELVEKMLVNDKKLPPEDQLAKINGVAYVSKEDKKKYSQALREVILMDQTEPELHHGDQQDPPDINKPEDLLYQISTSGSTGKPKSVMLEHRNFSNLLDYEHDHSNIDFSRVLHYASVGFDVSAQEIFSTLTDGGSLLIASDEEKRDPLRLMENLRRHHLTTLFLPPALLKFIFSEKAYAVQFPSDIRHIAAAGEQLVVPDLFRDYLKRHNVVLHNHYGPTETHVVTALSLPPDGHIPPQPTIGKPIPNTRIYILDRQRKLKPLGASGEIYIAGANVGRGYRQRDELTAEKFLRDPFIAEDLKEPNRMYRTGDRGRWLPDGNIQYLGRKDHQVKVRGYRVELGEIEAALEEHESITEAVVVDSKELRGETVLCGYIVANGEHDITELRDRLAGRLPAYMIPAHIIPLKKIPLNQNGKVDRKALPKPLARENGEINFSRYRDDVEKRLTEIWAQVLGQPEDHIGIDDNFFDQGGHSLKATMLAAKIHKYLNVRLPLTEIFDEPTIRGQAEQVKNKVKEIFVSLRPVEKKEYYPLSAAQKRLYFMYRLDPHGIAYNHPSFLELEGDPNIDKMETVLLQLIQRHESLRTSFETIDDQPIQRVHQDVNFAIQRGSESHRQDTEIIEEFLKPFELTCAPLMRVAVHRRENKRTLLLVDMHHIITDGTSMETFIREFIELYAGQKQTAATMPMPVQYKDYSEWENRERKSDAHRRQKEYWQSEYVDGVPLLQLPGDKPRPEQQQFDGAQFHLTLEPETCRRLRKQAAETETTLFMQLLAAANILFMKLSRQEDIVIGTPVKNRRHADMENIIGMFVNTLALRNRPNNGKTYDQFLREVRDNTLNAFENQEYQFEELVETLNLNRDPGRNPMFDVMLILQNYYRTEVEIPNLTITSRQYVPPVSKFDITITGQESDNGLALIFEYSIHLFNPETIRRWAGYLERIIRTVVRESLLPLSQLEILGEEERKKLLYEFNQTAREYPKNMTIHGLFEEQVRKTPDNTAIVSREGALTYGELNRRSEELAQRLKQWGAGPGTITALKMASGLPMAVAVLAILKSGSAYLPIDPGYPQDRIDYMMKDSQAALLVNTEQSIIAPFGQNLTESEPTAPHRRMHQWEEVKPTDPAYVIYTSGTTGRPKGVVVEHAGAVNTLIYRKEAYRHGTGDVVLQLFSISFDGFVTSFFTPLISGARLILPAEEEIKDISRLIEIQEKQAVTHFIAVPGLYRAMIEHQTPGQAAILKEVTLAGDTLTTDLLDCTAVKNKNLEISHEYGVTEASVMSTILRRQQRMPGISIGSPITNTRIYILDDRRQLQPIGVPGEIYIAGAGVARGYLNRPELTAQRFGNCRTLLDNGERLYKTGDLARWCSDGTIEFLGRLDHQVKIRGYRIELAEIRNRLTAVNGVTQAEVVDITDPEGEKSLCAYVETMETGSGRIREMLEKTLPGYMIPDIIIPVQKIPLNPNGKVDREALPVPGATTEHPRIAPRTPLERKVAELWMQVLPQLFPQRQQQTEIGVTDNFFRQGGHSLKATVLVSLIRKTFQVNMPLGQLFREPTIAATARYIAGAVKQIYEEIKPVEKKEYYPLSSAQKRLYFLQQMDPRSTGYNIPSMLNLGNDIRRDQIEQSVRRLIERHEGLRSSFIRIDDEPVQRIHEPEDLEFTIDIHESNDLEDAAQQVKRHTRPFRLEQAPLIRSAIVRLPDGDHLWLVDIHHIVADGTSMTLLTEDFQELYGGETLPPLELDYTDYAHWQNRLFSSGRIKNQEDYWKKCFDNGKDVPHLELPCDYRRPEVFTFEGERHGFMLETEETAALRKQAADAGGTLYMNVLAIMNVLFYRLTGQEDIVIGTGIAGRHHNSLQGIIGMFVNTLAMRNKPSGEKAFHALHREVVDNSVEAYENQDYQFEELVDRLELERDASRNPLFDVMMVVQNFRQVGEGRDKKRETGQIEQLLKENFSQKDGKIEYRNTTAKFDLTFFVQEIEGGIFIDVEYYTAVYKPATIQALERHIRQIIRQVSEDPAVKLDDIQLTTENERKMIRDRFNATQADYPARRSIGELFEEQVERAPEQIALRMGDRDMSYRQLSEKSNRVARYLLHEIEVQPGEPVGLLQERGFHMITAIMGVLKAGAAYVPLSPAFPEERMKEMVDDTAMRILLGTRMQIKRMNRLQWECPELETIVAMDSEDITAEKETANELMNRKLWDYVGETAVDEVTGGGWNSSYTGQPIPKIEMDEYGDNILKKLEPYLTDETRVLEIGCASGISMYRIAPRVGLYYGTDLSEVTVQKNKARVAAEGHCNIRLQCLAAHEIQHEIQGVRENNFHLVIINSVIQCFDGHNYLRNVLQQVIEKMAPTGKIFIGDIMDLDKKNALIENLTRFKRENKGKGYKTKTDWSDELFLSRSYWEDLVKDTPAMKSVAFSDKIYTIENELTRFRYDVQIEIDKTANESEARERRTRKKHKYQQDINHLRYYGTEKPDRRVESSGHAYIIFTSGSTGNPKGTLTTHYNVTRVVKSTNYIQLRPEDRILQLSDYAFDGSVFDIYGALLNGATLVMAERERLREIETLCRLIRDEKITVFFVTTALFNTIVDIGLESLAAVRKILFGGERVSVNHVRKALAFLGKGHLLHMYGPTETTVYATAYALDELHPRQSTVPIGPPISNTTIHILDRLLRPVPIGVKGEIYIGGPGLSTGYLNNPELTQERYIMTNTADGPDKCSVLYKTGDLGRWLPEGVVEFSGRIDQQVKVRGYRIELGEIENRLREHPAVGECTVAAREDQMGGRYLCAYIVAEEKIDSTEIKNHLAQRLPDYMVPAYTIQVEKMPLKSTGKIDLKQLPEPIESQQEDVALPQNPMQEKLRIAWSEVLGIPISQIGIDTNFFEVGGHSLKATVLTTRLHKELEIRFPLAEVFKNPTIRGQANYIESKAKKEIYRPVTPVEKSEYYRLSYHQKRLWVIQQLAPRSTAYHMSEVIALEGPLDGEAIRKAIGKLFQRHESFRTGFKEMGPEQEPAQYILPFVEVPLREYDISEESEEEKKNRADELVNEIIMRPFDLRKAPLFRAALVKQTEREYLLVYNMHHIISDGWSMEILKTEFNRYFRDYSDGIEPEPEPLQVQYKDFAEWHNRRIDDPLHGPGAHAYWDRVIESGLPPLNLEHHYRNHDAGRQQTGTEYHTRVGTESLRALKKMAAKTSTSLFTVLYTMYNLLLAYMSGQDEIVTAIISAGRTHYSLHPIIGYFVNPVMVKNRVDLEEEFDTLLVRTNRQLQEALQNQWYPLEKVLDRKKMEFPEITAAFNMLNLNDIAGDIDPELPDKKHNPCPQDIKFDILLFAKEYRNGIQFTWQYRESRFPSATIEKIAKGYLEILDELTISTEN
jgi:amino acid adenylation domain-containing protein/non-ribosomal peptide synthase protein (TIGR01720 family)